VAVSLIPMLSARMKTPPALKSPFITAMQARYARALRWTLEHRGWSVAGILAISLLSIYPMTHTQGGGDDNDPSEINIFYQWKGAYSKEEMGKEVARVEAFVNANRKPFHVERVYSRYSEQGWAQTRLFLDIEDPEQSKKIAEDVRKGLPKSARANLGIGWPGGQGNEGEGITFSLIGDSTQTLQELAGDILPMLARNPKLRDVRIDTGDANTELRVQVNRERAAAYGFSAREVAQFVGVALRGSSLRDFHREDVEIPVNVRFAGSDDYGMEDLSTFMVRAPNGSDVPLLAMVDVGTSPAATSIQRQSRQTMLQVQAGLAKDVSVEDARKAIETTLNGTQFPPGYSYTFDGAGFNINFDGMDQMMRAIMIALVLMLVIMAAVFESLLFPAGDHVLRAVLDLRRVLAVLVDRHRDEHHGGDRHPGADGRGGEQRHRDDRAHQQPAATRPAAHRGADRRQPRTPASDHDDDGHRDPGDDPDRAVHRKTAGACRRTTRWRARSPVAWRSPRWSACCSCRPSTRCWTTCAWAAATWSAGRG
jgi:HAE1 family hydrophobic/amphiphilic exporter-1